MKSSEIVLGRQRLDDALERLSRAPSLTSPERACVAYSGGGRAPRGEGRPGFGLSWVGSAVPWWLLPLRWIAAADRCLLELTKGDRVLTFAREADECFTIEFHSFRRELLPEVFRHLRSGGVMTEPAEIIDRDPTFFELRIFCDGAQHDDWNVSMRWGRECPPDLAAVAEALDAADQASPPSSD